MVLKTSSSTDEGTVYSLEVEGGHAAGSDFIPGSEAFKGKLNSSFWGKVSMIVVNSATGSNIGADILVVIVSFVVRVSSGSIFSIIVAIVVVFVVLEVTGKFRGVVSGPS